MLKISKILKKYTEKYHIAFLVFVIIYLIYTFLTYKDFPVTTDEQFRYLRGKELLDHYKNSRYLQTSIFPDKEPDTYYFYVMLLNIANPNFQFEIFHLQNMLFGLIAFIAVYLLVFSYTQNKNFSVLGPILLFLTPGFSGLIPANPIDIPFAVLIVLNLYLIYYFRNEEFSFKKIFVLGFSFWLLLGLRPVGYQIFFHLLVFGLFFSNSNKSFIQKFVINLKVIILIFFVSSFLSVISWPYLGINYFKNLPNILFVNAKYDKWDLQILFNQNFISKNQRPWSYLFVYLLYTLPLFIIAPLLSIFSNYKSKLKLFLLYFLVFNFLLYLVVNPVIYNGIRHFLYLLPVIVVLATFGIWDFYNLKINKNLKIFGLLIIIISCLWTLYEIYKMYPNQYAYFNEISGGFKKNFYKYETEYWGGMYKFGTIYIRDNLSTKNPGDLKVYSCNLGNVVDYYSKQRFTVVTKLEEANIIICDFVEDKKNNYQGKIIKEFILNDIPYLIIREKK